MKNTRTRHTPSVNARAALAAVREQETMPQLSKRYSVHANQICMWKSQLIDNVAMVFERGSALTDTSAREQELLRKIGELTVERDFLSNALERRR